MPLNVILDNPERLLSAILSEEAAAARERESSAFDQLVGSNSRSVVIFGAGGLGRRVLECLLLAEITPLAFADNNKALWGQRLNGIEILPPQVAAERYRNDAVFIVAIWNSSYHSGVGEVFQQLSELNCERITPFVWLFWKYTQFLPYYLWDLPSKLIAHKDLISRAYELFVDPESQTQFVRQVQFRVTGDFGCLLPPCTRTPYFPEDLYHLLDRECLVDCGAYDGDTIRSFIQRTNSKFDHIIAFEPDPISFQALERNLAIDPRLAGRVVAHPWAVSVASGKVRFVPTGKADASISPNGPVEIDCVTLDATLTRTIPTLIKMDIEGAEIDAISGASAVIRNHQPVMAVCLYHRQDDLWRIPLMLGELQPETRLFLRQHCIDGWELVCYSVPKSRPLVDQNK